MHRYTEQLSSSAFFVRALVVRIIALVFLNDRL